MAREHEDRNFGRNPERGSRRTTASRNHGMGEETRRIEFVLARDGETAGRQWVARTAQIYREAMRTSDYASSGPYRRKLQRAVREFEDWLAAQEKERSKPR